MVEINSEEQTYRKIFKVLGHEVAYQFYSRFHPDRIFPVHNDGWGFQLIEDLEYSESESRLPTLAHHFTTGSRLDVIATLGISASGSIIVQGLDSRLLDELSWHVLNEVKGEMQKWIGLKLF